MVDKMDAAYQFTSICFCGNSDLVILNRISSKFHTWFASIKSCFMFEYEFFFRRTIIKIAYKMSVDPRFSSLKTSVPYSDCFAQVI